MKLSDYQVFNNSSRKTLVFHFGTGAGFFSEYNNMLKAIAYCLIHKIKFVLYSADATFRVQSGWTDYFLPFTEEVFSDFHREYNSRIPDYRQTYSLRRYFKSQILSIIKRDRKWKAKYVPFYRKSKAISNLKKKYRFDYFTYDLWYDFVSLKNEEKVCIANLFEGKIFELISAIDKMIWRFNEKTQLAIDININKIQLKQTEFIGFHIRRGDKFKEAELFSLKKYIERAEKTSYIRNAFIATDDYGIIKEFSANFPNWTVSTLESPTNKGYNQDDFNKKYALIKYNEIVNILSSIELLSKAHFIVCTSSSNIGQYLTIKLGKKLIQSLD